MSRNLTPFKTPDVRTGRVHFKTFDDWVKARKMKSDMLLKDVSSFHFRKDGGGPAEILPQLQTAQQPAEEEW